MDWTDLSKTVQGSIEYVSYSIEALTVQGIRDSLQIFLPCEDELRQFYLLNSETGSGSSGSILHLFLTKCYQVQVRRAVLKSGQKHKKRILQEHINL